MPTYIGIDISKDTLDVSGAGLALHLSNDRKGHAELLKAVRGKVTRPHFICEPTGFYGAEVVKFLFAKRCKVTQINPYRVRQFAKAIGLAAKSDELDAALLAQAGETLQPPPDAKPVAIEAKLRAIVRRRKHLLTARVAQRQQAQQTTIPEIRSSTRKVVKVLSEEIDRMEEIALEIAKKNPVTAAKFASFVEVDGVGPTTALLLLAAIPEIGRMGGPQIAALAGLAPFNRDSGQKVGVRHIFGGRTDARTALFMAAFRASGCNPVLKPFYDRLRARGKPFTLAITAVMRKLLVYLNSRAQAIERTRSRSVGFQSVDTSIPVRGAKHNLGGGGKAETLGSP
jgi:transposase